jgi:hypothetical protein
MSPKPRTLALQEPAQTPVVQQAVTPLEMLNRALETGATAEVLEKFMALHERWSIGQARRAFDAAIADAKAKIKPVKKNRKVDFVSQKGRTSYEYEDLAEIAKAVDPILAEYGLSYRYRSTQDGNRLSVTCIMSHRDGHSEETSLTASNDESGNKNSIQAIGSAITYLQRYTLKLALGIAASKDDDAKVAAAPAKITEAQLNELIALADEANADKSKICEWLGVDSFPEISTAQFEKAKKALIDRRRRVISEDTA